MVKLNPSILYRWVLLPPYKVSTTCVRFFRHTGEVFIVLTRIARNWLAAGFFFFLQRLYYFLIFKFHFSAVSPDLIRQPEFSLQSVDSGLRIESAMTVLRVGFILPCAPPPKSVPSPIPISCVGLAVRLPPKSCLALRLALCHRLGCSAGLV